MSDPNSLCPVNWKLGQALMPTHFQRQEATLRAEIVERFLRQARPSWGVVELKWEEDALRREGVLLIKRLKLVQEDGTLIDVPGNARPVALPLPDKSEGPVDVYLHVSDRGPEVFSSDSSDQDGGFLELARLKLELTARGCGEAGRGFLLARFKLASPFEESDGSDQDLATRSAGWVWDSSYVPPLSCFVGFRPFALKTAEWFEEALATWQRLLTDKAYDEWLAVNKRVEAQACLRRAYELVWQFRHIAPGADSSASLATASGEGPTLRVHPFDVFQMIANLYLDAFSLCSTAQQVLSRAQPTVVLYRHEALAECFEALKNATTELLKRPVPRGAEQPFKRSAAGAMVCVLPETLSVESEVYFLVQFKGPQPARPAETQDGIDERLAGLRLGEPGELAFMAQRSLPGIGLERVRQVRFAHDFDTTVVQFYRLTPGRAWQSAIEGRRLGYFLGQNPIEKSSMYWPSAAERRDNGGESRP